MSLAARAASLLGGELAGVERLAGGDLSEVVRLTLSDGRCAVAKSGPDPAAEARMLRAIAKAGVPAPAVLAVDADTLVLAALPAGGSLAQAGADLGRVLARLHSAAAPRYGWDEDYAFGRVAIPNGWRDDWPTFWGEHRLGVHLPHLPAPLARRVEALIPALPDRLPARPRAALLHGDLWHGNVLADGGTVSGLIDPACYHGHGEVDLAMLSLFGELPPGCLDSYAPLEPGQSERRPLYQLWPALVHLRLFGSHYRGMAEALLAAAETGSSG